MKKNPIALLGLALILVVSCSAAFGQTAPNPKPDPTKRVVPNPAQDHYNKVVTDFNKATQDFNTARNTSNADAMKTANLEIATNIKDLEALARTPDYQNDATVHNLIGYLYLTQDNPTAAIPELQTTVRLKPDDLDAHNNLGNALRQQMRYDEAADQYRYVLDHFTPSPGLDTSKIKFNLATVLGQSGKTDQALTLFAELVAAPNPDAATYKNYGFFLQKAGRSVEAADAFRHASELDPKDGTALLSAGEIYAKNQRYDDAIATLTKAIGPDVSPKLDAGGEYDAYFALGESNAAKGNTNEAIRNFDMAAGLQPQNAVPVYNKGVLQEQAGLKPDAEASYRSALQKDPASVQIQAALGLLLADEGNAAESATFLAQAAPKLTQDAKAAPLYARLGDMYAKQNDPANADQARRRALALNPDDADVRLALADSDMARHQYVSALVQYDAAARLRPTDPTIQDGRGVAYKNLKQYPKALHAFQQALALDPRNAQVQNNIGVLYEMLGNKAQAAAAYKKALALNPSLDVARRNLNRFVHKTASY